MGVSISADCYRQSHDAHLIFNAIGNVESNNSHFRLSPSFVSLRLFSSLPFFPLISLLYTLYVTFFFSSTLRRKRDADTLRELCNFQRES